MKLDRNELTAETLVNQLQTTQVGVIVRGLSGVDPGLITSLAAAKLNYPLHVAVVGDYSMTASPNITLATDIESAVAWRNLPSLARRIVVFIQNESRKSHSLSDFDTLTARDLARHLLSLAEQNLNTNEPQVKFWAALRHEAATFPLQMIEDFVKAVYADKENPEAISNNLWRLGLLGDESILDKNKEVTERIRRNRELIEKMGQLSEQSRRRIGSVLTRAKGDEAERLRTAFSLVKEFHFRGNRDVLNKLDFATVEQLLETGRPLPATAQAEPKILEEPVKEEDEPNRLREEGEDYHVVEVEKPLKGKALQQAVAGCVVKNDPDTQQGLRELGEFLEQRLQNPQEADEDITITAGFDGRVLQPDKTNDGLRQFIGYVCAVDRWGGKLKSSRPQLKEAILNVTPEEVIPYNPDDPTQGQARQCLFSLLRGFDAHLPAGSTFSDTLDRFVTARGQLLEHLELILNYPLVLFGGYPESRQALNNYLDAYTELLRLFRDNEIIMHQRDSLAARFIATELLRLDTVYVEVADKGEGSTWKAMLTPLHPLHLWRFREIFNAIHIDQRSLTEDEQNQLAEALPKLPHLLHYLVLSPNAIGSEIILPQAGNLETLPTFENHTNRYLGEDGVDFVEELLRRWLDYAPYSRPQIRVGLVDAPNLYGVLKAAAEFLKSKRGTSVVIRSYYTRNQSQEGELVQLDFDDRDHDLAELMRTKRLSVYLQKMESVQAVIERLQSQPVHVLYMFDQSQYMVEYGPRARQLLVSPLVITYEYEYNEIFQRGTITPSSEAEEGVFAYYHFLVERAASLPAGQQIRLQYDPGAELTPINTLLSTEATRWLAIADRVLTNYSPQNAVPLGEKRDKRREIAVWAKVSKQAIKRFMDLLRRFNLRPDEGTVTDLLRRFGHVAAEGVISISMVGGNMVNREAGQKGLLGKLLAAKWYTTRYPGSLIASLDSNLAQHWLQSRPHGGERADLIGLRLDEYDRLIIEPIEVKTRSGGADVRIEKDPGGQKRLAGHAVEQLQAVIETLEPIFGKVDGQPLFTPARREVLRYQLYRECFHEVHDPDWQKDWYYRLKKAFAQPTPAMPVFCQGLILHIQLEESDDETLTDYKGQSLTLVKLGTKMVQRLIAPPLTRSSQPPSPPEPPSDPTTPVDVEEISTDPVIEPTVDDMPPPVPHDLPEPPGVDSGGQNQPPTPAIKVRSEPTASQQPQATVTPSERAEAEELSRLFMRACQSYRVQIDKCDPARAVNGPNVWRFYIRLARGQRLDPLRGVLEDIGREMSRSGLLITPIPNSVEVALDIPHPLHARKVVPITQGLSHLPPITSPEQMPILIGVTPEGQDVICDLGQMPHLLVGGTTGAGKSVFLRGLIVSLLVTHPDTTSIQLLLCSAAPEDFSLLEGLPHLETGSIVTEAAQAIDLLQNHVMAISDQRQEILRAAHCSNIIEYNARNPVRLPPFVVIVDEFADLADQLADDRAAQRAFYTQLRRIAQGGRKRGIHLILCTQRPSANLLPTDIRTLMNTRVALRVNDKDASRMILDENGAEQLQKGGDLLFKEQANLTRAQAYFVTNDDLDNFLRDFRGRV